MTNVIFLQTRANILQNKLGNDQYKVAIYHTI